MRRWKPRPAHWVAGHVRFLTGLLVPQTHKRGVGMITPEENIKTILADWLDALRRHDFATVERRLDPEVFWQGVREDFVCENRDEAMEMLREQQVEEHGVEALELIATEDRVILGIRSTQLQEIGACHLAPRSFKSSRCTTVG
jgi:hypothetical protein